MLKVAKFVVPEQAELQTASHEHCDQAGPLCLTREPDSSWAPRRSVQAGPSDAGAHWRAVRHEMLRRAG